MNLFSLFFFANAIAFIVIYRCSNIKFDESIMYLAALLCSACQTGHLDKIRVPLLDINTIWKEYKEMLYLKYLTTVHLMKSA